MGPDAAAHSSKKHCQLHNTMEGKVWNQSGFQPLLKLTEVHVATF
jgi:hypothetical protein